METKTIRQAVFDDGYVQELAAGLEQMPGRIRAGKETIVDIETRLKYNTAVADAKQAVVDIETEVAYEVFNDLDGNGKKKFSNEEKRKVEVRRRLVVLYPENYTKRCNALKDALQAEAAMKMNLGKVCAQFAFVEAEFKAKLAIAAMIAGLAHESTTQERIHRHVTAVTIGE